MTPDPAWKNGPEEPEIDEELEADALGSWDYDDAIDEEEVNEALTQYENELEREPY